MSKNRRTLQRSEEELGREGNGNYMTQIRLTISVLGNQSKVVIEPINCVVSYVATIPSVKLQTTVKPRTLGSNMKCSKL